VRLSLREEKLNPYGRDGGEIIFEGPNEGDHVMTSQWEVWDQLDHRIVIELPRKIPKD
jgi:hypothetical protein